MAIRTLEKPKFYVLYNDKIMRQGRLNDCIPFSFETESEAEAFILDHRASLIERGIPAKRWDFYIFESATYLDATQ